MNTKNTLLITCLFCFISPNIAASDESLELERELVDLAKYTCASEVKEGVDYEISTMADGNIEFKLLGGKGGDIEGRFLFSKEEWRGQQKVLIEDRAKLESEYKKCVVKQTNNLRDTHVSKVDSLKVERKEHSISGKIQTTSTTIIKRHEPCLNVPSDEWKIDTQTVNISPPGSGSEAPRPWGAIKTATNEKVVCYSIWLSRYPDDPTSINWSITADIYKTNNN